MLARILVVCVLVTACSGKKSGTYEIKRKLDTKSHSVTGLPGGELSMTNAAPKLEVTGVTGDYAKGLKDKLAASKYAKLGGISVDVSLSPESPPKSGTLTVTVYAAAAFAHIPKITQVDAKMRGTQTYTNASTEQLGGDLGDAIVAWLDGEKLPLAEIKPPAPAPKVMRVAAGDPNCSLHEDGTVRCWSPDLRKPIQVAATDGTTAIDAATNYGACGVLGNGHVYCIDAWDNEVALEAREVCGIEKAVDVSVGQRTACARLADGHIRCWGRDKTWFRPDCGATEALEIKGVSDAVAFDAGPFRSCAIDKGGTVRCWENCDKNCDSRYVGEIGHRSPTAMPNTSLTKGATQVQDEFQTCGVYSDHVKCVPDDKSTKLLTDTVVPESIKKLVTRGTGMCALGDKGNVYCWIGIDKPLQLVGISDATDLAGSLSSLCAVRATGVVVCWDGSHDVGEAPKPIEL